MSQLFGYRSHVMSFPNLSLDWAPTVTPGLRTEKQNTYSHGFDTSAYIGGSSYGSIDDATINGMVGSAGGGEVSLIRANYLSWDGGGPAYAGNPTTFGIKFSEAGAAASTNQTGWTSITVTDNGGTATQFNRADARTFGAPRYTKQDGTMPTGAPHNHYNDQYEYSWYVTAGDNPFGGFANATCTLSIVLP